MASPVLLLLLLNVLLALMPSPVWSYWYYGGGQTITPKRRNGALEVELRSKQTTQYCYVNPYTCLYGNCGSAIESTGTKIAWESYGISWCLKETTTRLRLNSDLPFAIRYPTVTSSSGIGYWISNYRGSYKPWRMMAHVDLGKRSDTHEANNPPISTVLPILRVPYNCPRTFNLTTFDPDGDRVRCRVPTDTSSYECGLCSLPPGFSLDEDSCSLTYTYSGRHGYMPIELVMEDFPNKNILLSYSDGSYALKQPFSLLRRKRQSPFWNTLTPTTNPWGEDFFTDFYEEPTTTTTTPPPTTTTEATTTTDNLPAAVKAALRSVSRGKYARLRYRSSIAPLSKLPLQFSVRVDSHRAPSCTEGEYIPLFISPTPVNGVHLPAFVNKKLEIKVKATALNTWIYRLLLTGPSGISNKIISREEYILSWTPTENEVNGDFPVCFVAESLDRYRRVYHSELRCVTVDVGHYDAIVTCNETTMTVEVEKTYLIRRYEKNLHLRSADTAECRIDTLSNSTHLVAVMSLDSCGTYVEEDEDNILYKNEISSFEDNQIISRTCEFEIAFCCSFPRKINLTVGFTHKNPYAFKEKGFGSFTFQFEFYQSQLFRDQVSPTTYPVKVYLKQMMYMQIDVTSSLPNVELFVESCRATPEDDPNSHTTYSIIENGCVKDSTVQIYRSSRTQFRFGMTAFEFIGAHNEVYITCSVLLCETGAPNTRCTKGCIQSGRSRGKREVASQTSNHLISQGPLRLVRSTDSSSGQSAYSMNLNLGLVVGCLLVVAVVVYRSRRSKVKYHPLPTSDSE